MMFRKKLVHLSQVLWNILFILSITIWRDISKIPVWATRMEILDETRWFWLMDAPKSSIENPTVIANFVYTFSIVQFVICLAFIVFLLKYSWKYSSRIQKAVYLALVLLGLFCSLLFELRMHSRFINMTDYYFLWHSLVTTEIFSIITFLLERSGIISKYLYRLGSANKTICHSEEPLGDEESRG